MLKQGKTTEEIKDFRRRVVKSQRLKSDAKEVDGKGDCIKWSPYDHSFEKGEMITTMSEHFRDAYDIELVCDFASDIQHYLYLYLSLS